MAKTVNNLQLAGAVGVEHSDERLAAVEEAKRTGHELQSVGAKGHDIVDRDTLRVEVEKVSNEGSSDPEQPLPDYLVSLQEGVEDTIALNQMKADEHNEYSREIVEAQQEAELADKEKLRQDPYYFANRIAENNRRLADEHNTKSAQYAEGTDRFNAGVAQEIRALKPEEVEQSNPVTALGLKSQVTDISESFAAEQLQEKDRIIYGEDSYKQQAKRPLEVAPSNERAMAAELIEEPMRIEEPVRNQSAADSKPADSPVIDGSADLAEAGDNEQKPQSAGGSADAPKGEEPKRRSSKANSKE